MLFDEKGQMTVEFVVVFPVLIIVALFAVNVLSFFGECAAFDRVSHEAVRIQATSPTYGQNTEQSLSLVNQTISDHFDKDNLTVSVKVEGSSFGHVTYTSTLEFRPTLFGMGLREDVFGVKFPAVKHSTAFTIDPYKPGILI
jgi:Flp pilus assembly protein TadG